MHTEDSVSPRNYFRIGQVFEIASHPLRLQVIELLSAGDLCVGDILERLGCSQPTASHHLALMRHTGMIVPSREGRRTVYTLADTGRKLAAMMSDMAL